MLRLFDSFEALSQFMAAGGLVLWLIALLVFVMWCLILERLLYFSAQHRSYTENVVADWNCREDKASWHAQRIREAILSRVSLSIEGNLGLIKTLIMLCPLLGLLGTVTGMIEVFTVLSISGSGDVKLIAGGISRATIPTMAGMVAALSGVFAMSWLAKKAEREKALIHDRLIIEH